MAIFEFTDYKDYIKSKLKRGHQVLLARQIGVQSAFLSQVLRGKPHLSLEQGVLISEYFNLGTPEQEYFMLALQHGRAGSVKLSNYFLNKMKQLREKHQRAEKVIGKFEALNESSKALFYSSWKYALIHVLTSLPASQQQGQIKRFSGLSEREIENILSFLKKIGLVEHTQGRLQPTKRRIHLSPEDQFISNHHKNIRLLTTHSLENINSDSLHYSSILALSESDAQRIKSLLLDAIADVETIFRPSPEETVKVFSMDFYGLNSEL